jgi:hypothetical protein
MNSLVQKVQLPELGVQQLLAQLPELAVQQQQQEQREHQPEEQLAQLPELVVQQQEQLLERQLGQQLALRWQELAERLHLNRCR